MCIHVCLCVFSRGYNEVGKWDEGAHWPGGGCNACLQGVRRISGAEGYRGTMLLDKSRRC